MRHCDGMPFLNLPGNLPDDLPNGWAERPLTDESLIADVLDLLVKDRDRKRGCILFALCDAEGRLMQPCVVDDLPPVIPERELGAIVSVFSGVLAGGDPPGSLLVAIGRAHGLSATEQDQQWRAAAEQACQGRITLLGVHVITTEGSRPVPHPSAAA
jgi:hypothetical protein